MKYRILSFVFIAVIALCNISHAEEQAYIESFSPQGTVKGVRQVSVRFSEQMVPFGDPRIFDPFEINCPAKGRGRWADGKNWIYDFDKDLPAGVICEFTLKADIKTLSERKVGGEQKFSFSTGGPAIKKSIPYEGARSIHENQIFILTLDAEATEESMLENVHCSVEGINERIGVNIIKGEERKKLLESVGYRDRQIVPVIVKDEGPALLMEPDKKEIVIPRIVLQCRQNFPNRSEVHLVWGKGVKSLSGVETEEDQIFAFKTREPFHAVFGCSRENKDAHCIPLLPMYLRFSSPVSWEQAGKIALKDSRGKLYKLSAVSEDGENGNEKRETKIEFVNTVEFRGPFPENASFTLEIPKNLKDDSGRQLSNADSFPLATKTDAYPPLAKFSARFGIIEFKEDAVLPVTLRNLEPEVKTRMLRVEDKKEGLVEKAKEGVLDKTVKIGEAIQSVLPESMKEKTKDMVEGLKGRLHKVKMDKEEKIIDWLKTVAEARRKKTILKNTGDVKDFSVPKPGGAKAFEVVGIPLKEPGLYVVEMESRILGASLLGEQMPMYVPTAALVTNLSVHFKWGRESSLVWVTTLNKAEPVKEAEVTIRDCNGKPVWSGKTDSRGIAYIKEQLPSWRNIPSCSRMKRHEKGEEPDWYDRDNPGGLQSIYSGLFVFAKAKEDIAFAHSSWNSGIEPWRFNLPEGSYRGPVIAHTILDRTLLRAGETVHMKHIMRKHTMAGFAFINESELPKAALIEHTGSEQRYEFPLKWDRSGIAETVWKIPKDAKLGNYTVRLLKQETRKKIKQRTAIGGYEEGDEGYYSAEGWNSGSFRVEEFRIPLMKGMIQPPKDLLVNASEAAVDLFLTYLSGGGAGLEQVKLRSSIEPKMTRFEDYEEFMFANGIVKEGISKEISGDYYDEWDAGYHEEDASQRVERKPRFRTTVITLDKAGAARTSIDNLPKIQTPHEINTELEFKDPNGEIQTVSSKIPLWPSKLLVGIKPDSWASSKEAFKFHVAVLNLSGKPVTDIPVKVDILQSKHYSHRKRLVGGFYSYENVTETKRIGQICEGKTDRKGLLICEAKAPVSGNVIIEAKVTDDAGNFSAAHRDVWVADKKDWWFRAADSDRIDILPERKRYETGDTAKIQVRMPFREATALVTIEREGVIDSFVRKISAKKPVIELYIKKNYSPNVYVSVLCVRGRVKDAKPTALVDLGKPAFKLGMTELKVGWKPHELKVNVTAEKKVYRIREKAFVKIKVRRADSAALPKDTEAVVAAVDEGLLELMQNTSWNLLEAMMGRRGCEVKTSTAQMHVVGKRHFGLKALPHGGGGGKHITREMFDTLLLWKARVRLDEKGEASVEVPLNDSLTAFRIIAVANGGTGLFGTGQTTIRTTQDLMLLSGIPPFAREGDRFKAGITVRNASDRKMEIEVAAGMTAGNTAPASLQPIRESLGPGEVKEIGWDIDVPHGIASMDYEISAAEKGGDAADRLKIKQKIAPAVPVRVFQATITQVARPFAIEVEKPDDAIRSKGGVNISFRSKLSEGLGGVVHYMRQYPYTCMEQKLSRAIALRDVELWKSVIAELPSHLDSEGLVKYFASMRLGSETLTSYLLSIADEAGWKIPEHIKERMEKGLTGFIEGRVIRYSSLPTADLHIRKMAAMEALSRSENADPALLGSINIEPNLWPTSAVIDWMNVILRMKNIHQRDKRLKEAEQILRSRLNFQGTTMGFSTEKTDFLWWLMISGDVNAVRSILTFVKLDHWNEDMPRLVRGAIGRQYRGAWNTTTANAWGVLAMEKFSQKFESVPVTGITSAKITDITKDVRWEKSPKGGSVMFGWPKGKESLAIHHEGTGRPWATIQSLAAIPLKEPFSSGYKIKKTLMPVEQKEKGRWSRGDVVRVRLELEAQADMTWVVVSDPVPAGSTILGTGLGRDSELLTKGEQSRGWVWPAFQERSFEAFRSYYEFVPKGKWTVEYTIRLNNPGIFHLPETRVEALYSPEMIGESPNKKMEVEP